MRIINTRFLILEVWERDKEILFDLNIGRHTGCA